jgi:flagellar biosynthetic protein FliR
MNISLNEIELFILIMARITAIFVLFPLFSSPSIPLPAKVGGSFFVAVLLFPLFSDTVISVPKQTIPFLLMLSKEVLVGLVLGFVALTLFAGIHVAGQLAGMQMGFAIVNAIDPQTQQNVSIIASFQNLIATMIFLSINGHLFLLSGIKKSFEVIPLMGLSYSPALNTQIIKIGADIFIVGIKIGAPVITALLLTSVALGIMAKVFPQMNVFFVGLPLKIGLGITVVALSLPLFFYAFGRLFNVFQNNFSTIIQLLH